jgi:D-arginine dehydrogenase
MATPARHADTVVIGAGIAGLSVAWRLAATQQVVVVETESQPATHATGRSAAMLNVTSGPPEVCALARDSAAFLADPPQGFAAGSLLSPRGLLWVGGAGTQGALAALVAKAPDAARMLDAAEARALVPRLDPSAVAAGGVHEPGAMAIDVAALVEGFRRGLVAGGGHLVTGGQALALEPTNGAWRVRTTAGDLTATTVVNAAGAWADEVARRAGVAPLGLAALRRTAAVVNFPDVARPWPMVMDVHGAWYALWDAGGLLISPADQTPQPPGDARADEVDVSLAIDRVSSALGTPITHVRRAWAGLRTFTPDGLPALGRDPRQPSFIWLVGQGGAGIKTSPAISALVADVVVRDLAVPGALDVARFGAR